MSICPVLTFMGELWRADTKSNCTFYSFAKMEFAKDILKNGFN